MGNTVTCVDLDQEKIDALKKGRMPIFDPGLEAVVKQLRCREIARFITSLVDAMRDSEIYIIAVGTPPNEDGRPT